ncbi:hypothetical protein GQ55_6G108400 [Panicum hallii var. hallii]|jgi:hypothetical protein|uniref:Uncharacterized protein n=2 Tax=Panicum hallii TaxID=206008 RepID=A0A2T7D5S2_9POAL|nr:hypothetical protein GQ55_6G108400 [Panicum hallii var. hallii]PVH36569.1 hypothetical protein PAHAL_6G106000 [Panicum hallii]
MHPSFLWPRGLPSSPLGALLAAAGAPPSDVASDWPGTSGPARPVRGVAARGLAWPARGPGHGLARPAPQDLAQHLELLGPARPACQDLLEPFVPRHGGGRHGLTEQSRLLARIGIVWRLAHWFASPEPGIGHKQDEFTRRRGRCCPGGGVLICEPVLVRATSDSCMVQFYFRLFYGTMLFAASNS